MKLIELGTILHLEKGKKPLSQLKEPAEGYLPYVDIKAFEQGVIDNYASPKKALLCEQGDLLIVGDGSRSGLTGRAIKGVVGSTLFKIYADGVSTDYLKYSIESKYLLLNTKKKGTGTPHLNTNILKESKIFVPALEEQERIVARIEELFSNLDNAVKTLKATKSQLAVYKQAVLKEAFSKFTEKIPLKEITSVVTSGSRGWAKYYSDKGARFIRITDLTRDSIILKNKAIQRVLLPENIEGKRSRLQARDVLVSITADLGSIALIPENINEAYINQHIATIRFINSNQSEFMAWYLKSNYGQKDLLRNKRGGGKLGLGLDDIRNTPVPIVNDDIANQIVEEIKSRLFVCDNIEQTIDHALSKAKLLRQSILKQTFEGRLI